MSQITRICDKCGAVFEPEKNILGGYEEICDDCLIAPINPPSTTINPKDLIGAKKVDLSLVPSAGIINVALCMMNGATKYGPYNWRNKDKKVGTMTYLAAAMRHIEAYLDGEEVASDSGYSHLGHAASSLFILMDAIATGFNTDDRPPKGAAARLLDENDRSKKE